MKERFTQPYQEQNIVLPDRPEDFIQELSRGMHFPDIDLKHAQEVHQLVTEVINSNSKRPWLETGREVCEIAISRGWISDDFLGKKSYFFTHVDWKNDGFGLQPEEVRPRDRQGIAQLLDIPNQPDDLVTFITCYGQIEEAVEAMREIERRAEAFLPERESPPLPGRITIAHIAKDIYQDSVPPAFSVSDEAIEREMEVRGESENAANIWLSDVEKSFGLTTLFELLWRERGNRPEEVAQLNELLKRGVGTNLSLMMHDASMIEDDEFFRYLASIQAPIKSDSPLLQGKKYSDFSSPMAPYFKIHKSGFFLPEQFSVRLLAVRNLPDSFTKRS